MPKRPTLEDRPVVYDDYDVRLLLKEDALTAELAKEILGWTVPEEGHSFEEYHLKDNQKRTVYVANVEFLQRHYDTREIDKLKWEILQGNWRFNFDNIIVTRTGLVVEGKTRLAALIFAVDEYYRNPERYPFWSEEPTIEVSVAYGLEDDIKTVNTLGTGKPRSVADSLYASGLFAGATKQEMKNLCRITSYTIRLLWERTGAKEDAYNPRASHADAFNFLDRHQRLVQCVHHVHGEDAGSERRLSRYLGAGYLAGLCYLASCSKTAPDNYWNAPVPSEDLLDFSAEEQAEEFLVLLSGESPLFKPLIAKFEEMTESGNTSIQDRIALMARGYGLFMEGKKMNKQNLNIDYSMEDGVRVRTEDPVLGGIDKGSFREE